MQKYKKQCYALCVYKHIGALMVVFLKCERQYGGHTPHCLQNNTIPTNLTHIVFNSFLFSRRARFECGV